MIVIGAGGAHGANSFVGVAGRAQAVGERLPLTAGAEDEADGIHRLAIRHARALHVG